MRSLEITTQIGCPLMCTFCPQDKLRQAYKNPEKKMSMETYCTVLDKLPLDVEIIFAGYTEPWANKLCTQFVTLALERGFNISIYTTLYNITKQECDELVIILKQYAAKIKQFWIHLPDRNGNMLGFRYDSDYAYTLAQIKQIKGLKVAEMTMDADSLPDPAIQIPTTPANWYLHTRANNLTVDNIKTQPVNLPPRYEYIVECTRNKEYQANVLLPNGDVMLCCMDYSLKHNLGNLLTSSYEEVINGAEVKNVAALNKKIGYSDQVLCRSCNDGFCHTPWNNKEVYEIVKQLDPDSLGL